MVTINRKRLVKGVKKIDKGFDRFIDIKTKAIRPSARSSRRPVGRVPVKRRKIINPKVPVRKRKKSFASNALGF